MGSAGFVRKPIEMIRRGLKRTGVGGDIPKSFTERAVAKVTAKEEEMVGNGCPLAAPFGD
jgi:hypothetical protein